MDCCGKKVAACVRMCKKQIKVWYEIEFFIDSLKCWRLMLTFLLCLNDGFTIPLCFHIYLYCLNGRLYGERIYKMSVRIIMKCFGAYLIQLQTQLVEYHNAILPIWWIQWCECYGYEWDIHHSNRNLPTCFSFQSLHFQEI